MWGDQGSGGGEEEEEKTLKKEETLGENQSWKEQDEERMKKTYSVAASAAL